MNSKFKNINEKGLFPLILIIWPLINSFKGLSLSDMTYSLTNYRFFDSMTGSWKYATYVANLFGSIMVKLCGGNIAYVNIFAGFVVSFISLFIYLSMKNEIGCGILFVTLLLSESLCWCPQVILYNYLTYLCFSMAAVVIYKAVTNNNKVLYFVAGIILGISFFVRISNVVQVILILSVWLGIYLYKGRNKKAKWIKPTLLCIGGYISGAGIVLLIIIVSSGIGGVIEAFQWATGLLTASDDAGGYSFKEMIKTIVQDYVSYAKWLLIMLAGIVAGILGFMTLKDKLVTLKKIGYIALVLILFVWFNRNGLFNIYYRNTGAIFGLSVIFILCQFMVLCYTVFDSESGRKEKLLSFIAITVLLVTPLGSNNHLFTLINSMFFTAPISLWLFLEFYKDHKKEVLLFPLYSMMAVFFTVFMIQALLFHINYQFNCGENGDARDYKVSSQSVASMVTMEEKQAGIIDEAILISSNVNPDGLILYGNIPGLSYILNTPSAISTSWPDLDSYSKDTLKEDLANVKGKYLVIIANDTAKKQDTDDDKLNMIMEFISDNSEKYEGSYITAYYR